MASLAENAGWLFGWLLRNSAHATFLAGVVLLLERTVCRGMAPRWRYGLWLLVVVRLVIPIAPGSPLSLFNLVDLVPASMGRILCQVLGLPSPVPVTLPGTPHPLADTPPWFLSALALWVPGALILGGLLWRDQQRLQDALQGQPVTDPEVQDLLVQSKAVMCVRRHVELVETARMTSPAITGWWRPRLLLPEGLLPRLTRDEIRFLFLHELAHVKRGDIALNWLLAAVQVLHWFNPAIWFALRRLLTIREEVCDDLVLRRSFQGAAREYGLTLIRILEECAPRRLLPAYAGVLDDIRSLRQRVRCIRDFGIPETNPWRPAAVTVMVAVAGLTERTHEHALLANIPAAYAEVPGHVRPSVLKQIRPKGTEPGALAPTPATPATPADGASAGDVGGDRSFSPAGVLEVLRLAFERAVRETRGLPAPVQGASGGGNSMASASESTSGLGTAAAAAGAGRGSPASGTVAARSVRVSGGASGQAWVRPAPMTPSGAQGQTQVRPGPLPPIHERGSILRPGRSAAGMLDGRSAQESADDWNGAGGGRPAAVSLISVRRPES